MFLDRSDWARDRMVQKRRETSTKQQKNITDSEAKEWTKALDNINPGQDTLNLLGANLLRDVPASSGQSDA
eukprot:13314013-Alexandrium_andersonii.AAC.1